MSKQEDKTSALGAYEGLSDDESIDYQIKEWAKGNPTHNLIRDECCPDFSCCYPSLLMEESVRKKFLESYLAGDTKTTTAMLGMCLGNLISKECPDNNVYIADGTDPTVN